MMKLNIQLFGHSGETTNYDLPQFVGTDKPTWLGDINTAMSTIDTAIAGNASDISSLSTRVSGAESTAQQASTDVAGLTSTVSTLSTNVQTATTTANNAQGTASSALSTANTAQTTATTADGKADTNASAISGLDTRVGTCEDSIANFNLTNYNLLPVSKVSGTFTMSSQNLYCATNSDGSLAKIYGSVTATNITADGVARISTSLRPEEDITITGGTVKLTYTSSGGTLNIKNFSNLKYTIKTNGNVEFAIEKNANGDSCRIIFINSLIYVKNFGDTPGGE